MLSEIARAMILVGLILLGVGGLLLVASRLPGMGRLPGDVVIRKDHLVFYFPLATSLLLSLILSVLFYLFHRK